MAKSYSNHLKKQPLLAIRIGQMRQRRSIKEPGLSGSVHDVMALKSVHDVVALNTYAPSFLSLIALFANPAWRNAMRKTCPSLLAIFSCLTIILCACDKNTAIEVDKSIEVLGYHLISKRDTSGSTGRRRMVYRITLDVEDLPKERALKNTAFSIYRGLDRKWDEFTIQMLLPGGAETYCMSQFKSGELEKFQIYESIGLLNTKWEYLVHKKEAEDTKRIDQILKERESNERVKEYHISVQSKKIGARKFSINANTNFPDGTILSIWVYRAYSEKDPEGEYYGKILKKEISVNGGKLAFSVNVDDSVWYNERLRKIAEWKSKGMYDLAGKISNINPAVTVRVAFHPSPKHPEKVINILGRKGEFIKGKGVQGVSGSYVVEKTVEIPFKK